jgi:hypothetical protein
MVRGFVIYGTEQRRRHFVAVIYVYNRIYSKGSSITNRAHTFFAKWGPKGVRGRRGIADGFSEGPIITISAPTSQGPQL